MDIVDGHVLAFECPIPRCRWYGRARLPKIQKQIVYLDTSTVSHIAKVVQRNEADSPWNELLNVLRRGVRLEAICCPGSSILEQEADLSKIPKEIIQLSRTLADPGMRHELQIKRSQVVRALRSSLAGTAPQPENCLDSEDAFYQPVHRWLPSFHFSVNTITPPAWIESRRTAKAATQQGMEEAYKRYAEGGVAFEEMVELESSGFGTAIIAEHRDTLALRLGHRSLEPGEEVLGSVAPTTFDTLVSVAMEKPGVTHLEASKAVIAFLQGPHLRRVPVVDIMARLHAGLAMLHRGETSRVIGTGDSNDIEHIACVAPYVDVLITDRFFADLCNQGHMEIGQKYSCSIRSLRPREVLEFANELQAQIDATPQRALAERIQVAIREGGSIQDFDARAASFLAARGVFPKRRSDPT